MSGESFSSKYKCQKYMLQGSINQLLGQSWEIFIILSFYITNILFIVKYPTIFEN